MLQAADLPKGSRGTPHKADPSAAAGQAALAKCVGVRNVDTDKVAEAQSDDFALGGTTISSSAASYRSQINLDADLAKWHSPKLSACYGKWWRTKLAASIPQGATIDSASFKVTPRSADGPANVVATGKATIKVRVSGQQAAFYLSVAFITGPLVKAQVSTVNIGKPFPASQMKSLVAAVATRAAKG